MADLVEQLRDHHAREIMDWDLLIDAATELEALRKRCEAVEADAARLRAFAQDVMECWPEGSLDGGEIQETAERHGVLVRTEQTVPCGENCGCTEFYDIGATAECYRLTPLVTGKAIAAAQEPSHG